MDHFAKLVGAALLAVAGQAHAQTYQVGQYLGNLNEAGRFAYATAGSAAQHAQYSPAGTWSAHPSGGVRLTGQAVATIGGRAVPLTLISRTPPSAIFMAARGLALANPGTAALTLLGFAAMQGWLTPAGLEWNTDAGTNKQQPFLKPKSGWDSQCYLTAAQNSQWQADVAAANRTYSDWVVTATPHTGTAPNGNCQWGWMESHHSAVQGRTLVFGPYWSIQKAPSQNPNLEKDKLTWDQAQPYLEGANPTDPNIVPQLLQRGASFPAPVNQTVSGPASQPGQRVERNLSNGDKSVTQTTHNYTYNNNNVTHNTTTTTTVTNVNNEVVSEETETTDNEAPKEDTDMCAKNPDILACQKLDKPEDVDLETQERQVSITPDSGWGGAGQCPAPRYIYPQGRTIAIPFDLFCMYAEGLRPVIIAMAWLSAGFILLGARGGD